jgi:alcohol dehydrogenase
MRSLVFVRPGRVEWREAPTPVLRTAGDALVRPIASSTCDLDRLVLGGRTPLRGPFAFGHQCVAEVVELADDVSGLRVGDAVSVPWHVACGTCRHCRAGLPAQCATAPPGAGYGLGADGAWGGLFDDAVRVPCAQHVLVRLEPALDVTALTGLGDDLPLPHELLDRHLRGRCDQRVLVLGAGSTGLYAVDTVLALGAWQVVYADRDPSRRGVATALGAHAVERPAPALGEFDVVVDAAADAEVLPTATRLLAPGGAVESTGVHLTGVPAPRVDACRRGLPAHTGARAHVADVLDLVRQGRLRPDLVVSGVHAMDDAPDVLRSDPTKPVFVRDRLSATA